jgi:hypothetical protein
MSIEVAYFNSFLLKRLQDGSSVNTFPKWLNGTPDNTNPVKHWYVEEARIRGGYNNTSTDYGVKAYIVEDEPKSQQLTNGLIYSGIFNSKTGFNETNVFSVGESITKSVDPAYGSIQKLYAEDTNLNIFQESKVSRALIDKDAIYSAEGGGTVTSTSLVIGQIVPYAGEFGISNNPESFAVYGYQKYFADARRNAVLRLSRDGITEISNYGMKDWFRDEFNANAISKIIGAYDVHNKVYKISVQNTETWQTTTTNNQLYFDSFDTLYYDESVKGWPSFASFKPTLMGSIRNKFFSFVNGKLYQHYSDTANRGDFYGIGTIKSHITFTFNPNISAQKVFKTLNYEGSNGWEVISMNTKDTSDNFTENRFDTASRIYSYGEGEYTSGGVTYYAGFNRKENKYFANIINSSTAKAGEVVYGNSVMGIKGFFATVKIQTDTNTNPGQAKELFAVSSEYIESSY